MNNNSIDKLDSINKKEAAKRLAEYKQAEGIRVGDYLKLPNGRYTRFTYDWEDGTIQAGGHSQSQYDLYSKGHVAYSGRLDPVIDKNDLQLTPEEKVGYMNYYGEFTGEEGVKSCVLEIAQRVFEVKPGHKLPPFYDNPKLHEKVSADGSKFEKGGGIFNDDKERKIKAIKAYYAGRPQLKTLEEARKQGNKFGNWIIKVEVPDGTEFYTMTTFNEKWVYPGAVYGMWNELTLIEKAGSSMAKGGTIDTDTALLPEVIAYYLAESVILEKWKGKLTKENDAAIQEEIADWQDYLTKRAEYLYKNNEGFKKKVKARGDNGLHYLNMMMAHWMGVQDERIGGSYGAKTDLAGAEKAKKRWLESLKPQKKMEQGGEIEKVSGIFYRVDTGFTPPRGTTALDVVNFEADELDNEDSKIGRDKMKAAGIDLSKYSWKDITWVTKTKKHATRYGSARNVQQVEIKNGIIVSEDGDEGYLILELEKSGINMEEESKKWQERKKLGYILPEPIAVFQEKTDKGTNIGLKIRYYNVGERDWWYQLVGDDYKPTEKPVYGKSGHWVSKKQYPTVKSLEKYHQNDNIFLVQDGNEQQSNEPLIYSEWSKKFLADFYAKHPNSTAPSNHVMSNIYDDYASSFKMKQGGEILTWRDLKRHNYNASHLNVKPIPAGDKAKTYHRFNVDAIYFKGKPIPVGCLSSSFSDQVGELMRGANYVNNPANTKKVLDRFKKWAVDEYIFDKKGTYKRKELGLTPEKKFNVSTDELNKFIAQINSIESLDDITYSVARQRYEQGGEIGEIKSYKSGFKTYIDVVGTPYGGEIVLGKQQINNGANTAPYFSHIKWDDSNEPENAEAIEKYVNSNLHRLLDTAEKYEQGGTVGGYNTYNVNLVTPSSFDFKNDYEAAKKYWKEKRADIEKNIISNGSVDGKEIDFTSAGNGRSFLNLVVTFRLDSKNKEGLENIKNYLKAIAEKYGMYLEAVNTRYYSYGQGGNITEHKKVTFKGDNTPYFIIKDQGDNARVVIDEKYDLWKKATPIERYEYYEEVIPKSEFNEFELTDSEALDFVINVLTERKNLVVPEFTPPYKVITPKMIEDYKQAHMLMDAMLMKAHAENNEALVKKLQNLEFITWTLKVEQGAIRMNDLQSLGDYIAEAKALKCENFKQGGVIGKYKKLKAAAQELTIDDEVQITVFNKQSKNLKTVAKKHGIPASSLFDYMQTKKYLMGDDAESIIEKSYELGIAANKAGKARVPFHDKELEALVKQRANSDEMGSAIPYYDAWTKGFDSENRRAAFAVLNKPENAEMNEKFRNDFLKNRKKITP